MNKFQKSQKEGDEAYDLFVKMAEKRGFTTMKAPDYVDMYDHIDVYLINEVTKASVDVKNWKRKNRHDENFQDEDVFIEFRNVGGYKGWIYGKADLIAFRRKQGFMLVVREKLLKYCESVVDPQTYVDRPTLYKMYRRSDRPYEAVSLIKFSEIPKEYYITWCYE